MRCPGIVGPSPIVTHTHRGRGWPWPSLMLRSGLLAEAGAGRGCLSLKERPSQHNTHPMLTRTIITQCQCYASWLHDPLTGTLQSLQPGQTADMCITAVHCRLQTHTCYVTSCRQIITLQCPHADPGEAGRGHGWLVTDIMPSSEERPATSWPMEPGADQPQPLPALYQWSAPRRLCTQYLLETA